MSATIRLYYDKGSVDLEGALGLRLYLYVSGIKREITGYEITTNRDECITALEAENAKLRAALQDIVDHDTGSAYDIPAIVMDIARDALAE